MSRARGRKRRRYPVTREHESAGIRRFREPGPVLAWAGSVLHGRRVVEVARAPASVTVGLLSRGSQVRVLPGAPSEIRRGREKPCKSRNPSLARPRVNGKRMRRSAPPTIVQVASWSHPGGVRSRVGRSSAHQDAPCGGQRRAFASRPVASPGRSPRVWRVLERPRDCTLAFGGQDPRGDTW
jgi:hypothetical protein